MIIKLNKLFLDNEEVILKTNRDNAMNVLKELDENGYTWWRGENIFDAYDTIDEMLASEESLFIFVEKDKTISWENDIDFVNLYLIVHESDYDKEIPIISDYQLNL